MKIPNLYVPASAIWILTSGVYIGMSKEQSSYAITGVMGLAAGVSCLISAKVYAKESIKSENKEKAKQVQRVQKQ